MQFDLIKLVFVLLKFFFSISLVETFNVKHAKLFFCAIGIHPSQLGSSIKRCTKCVGVIWLTVESTR